MSSSIGIANSRPGRVEGHGRWWLAGCSGIALVHAFIFWTSTPMLAIADGPLGETVTPGSELPKTHVDTEVVSRPDGVYIKISVRQNTPGRHSPAPQPVSAQRPTNAAPPVSETSSTSSATDSGRWWTDRTGIHHETPDGHRYDLTIPNISSATRAGWQQEFQNHPDATPYTLDIDGQFQGIIWIPNRNNNNIRFGSPPAEPVANTRPTGDGSSTDPREVALDALGHVPLPNVRIRTNPALGLVAMPGWFWVEGYDGAPFGTSRTVSIPPEVGPEVPFDVVPADDSRRQGSSFTVEVRVWPSRYEWRFGDGATLATESLGKPYPAESDIQHTYEYSSLQFPNGFPVWLTIEFAAEFRVNGGPTQGLPPIRQTYETAYRVREVQPVLTSR